MAGYRGHHYPERPHMTGVKFARIPEAYRDPPFHRWRCSVYWDGGRFVTSSAGWSKLSAFVRALTWFWKAEA